ncbi:MAG: hypothetical protein M1826_004528 [Phylliscum demangeonii]|nr:MAG: hypothetical protein M1826_004528 [Phylliscum demangeonii]
MNHATIRPDGEMLVAVGDEAYAYFYRRLAVKTPTVRGVFDRRSNHPAWRWELQARFDLPRAPDPADNGLFATAFSSSGRHCAVASQDGIITVFDTGAIRDSTSSHTAIVATLSSSRPHSRTGEGAIRSICFSPSPWDLLICVEQSGRACVYDLRSGFRMRQPVDLCPQSVGVQRVEIHDESAAAEDMIDPRLRQSTDMEHIRQYRDSLAMRDEAAAAEFATDYMESAGDRRRLLRPVRHDSPQATTERERQVLDALRTSHERVEARDQGLNYRPARELRDPPSLQSDAEMIGPFLSGSSSGTTPPRRDRLRDRNPDRDSTRARPYEPHRRDSVVITDDHRNVGDTVYDLITGVRTSATSTSHPRTSRLDPWQALEGEVQLRQERETGRGSIWSNRQYLTALMELERRNARRLVESRRREHIRSVYTEMVRTGRQDDPPPRRDSENHGGTTGCAMSGDGRKLYGAFYPRAAALGGSR